MLDGKIYNEYVKILKNELMPALGCTEPIAVAYAAAKAREVLGMFPERIEMQCSGNIIKNVMGVTVPNTGGLKGIDAAAIAGAVGGNAERGLEVLQDMTDSDINRVAELLEKKLSVTTLAENTENLYIAAKMRAGASSSEVQIKDTHTNIVKIVKDGKTVFEAARGTLHTYGADSGDRSLLTVRAVLEFANTCNLDDVRDLIKNQIELNSAISDEGLTNQYGVNVGKNLLESEGTGVKTRAKARAAAGSDARMSGCSMPVVINSGSGNQGMTVSLPVIEYAKELKVSEEKLYRALVLSNLVSIHQKTAIGRLSAYCGAVSAAAGSGAAITYLRGGNYDAICRTIINTICNIGGMVCDGAKPSCAAKIASAVDAAIMGCQLAMDGQSFHEGEGLAKSDIEETIANIGRLGSKGMKTTDVEILKMMIK